MLQMGLPHLNVLTKIDNLATYPPLPLPLDFYTEARSLEHVLPYLDKEQRHQLPGGQPSEDQEEDGDDEVVEDEQPASKFTALNEAIVELVEDYGLVGFEVIAVEDRALMLQLLHAIDRAGGYAFGTAEGVNESVWELAVREGGGGKMEVRDIEERWVDRRQEYDDLEKKMWEEEGRAVRRKAGVPESDPSGARVTAEGIGDRTQIPKTDESSASGIKVLRKASGS